MAHAVTAAPVGLDAAASIGTRLCDAAIWYDDRCNWTGDLPMPDGTVVHSSMPGDLYTGTSGIGWYLAHLGVALDSPVTVDTARGALNHALAWADRSESHGLYTGSTGVALAAVSAGNVTGDAELARAGERLAQRAADTLVTGPGQGWDVISGDAGVALAHVVLGRLLGCAELVASAVTIGARLAAAATEVEWGRAWATHGDVHEPPLCGFAHGASGAALALLEVSTATDRDGLDDVAADALRYERAWYDRPGRGWPDLREIDAVEVAAGHRPGRPYFWCHGATGIGLTRLRWFQLTGDRVALAEAAAAIDTATRDLLRGLRHPVSSYDVNLSLCHGAGSVAELHLMAASVTGDDEHVGHTERLMSVARAAGHADRLECGIAGGGETPGLMLGVAGIGATLLRLHDRSLLPSPLLLTDWA